MASRRDLAEAQAFERRRLVTAFGSGAPGGQEVEPPRPGRLLLGGAVLAVLVLAGSAAVGQVVDREDPGWRRPGLLVLEESGALYVVLEERDPSVVHAVPNVTSALLLLEGPVEPRLVPGEIVASATRGADLGLPAAPAEPPAADRLVPTGWTACAAPPTGAPPGAPGGLVVSIAASPRAAPAPGAAFVVRSGEERHLVAEVGPPGSTGTGSARRFRLPDREPADRLLRDLGLPIWAEAVPVPAGWLDLLPAGAALDLAAFGIEGRGEPVPDAAVRGLPPDIRVGDLVEDPAARAYLVTRSGAIVLDPFASLVHRHLLEPGEQDPERVGGAPARIPAAPGGLEGGRLDRLHWPTTVPAGAAGQPCVLLRAAPGELPTVSLARDPRGPASGLGVAAGRSQVRVAPGAGAYVRVVGSGDDTTYLVDGRGRAHRIEGRQVAEWLGYDRDAVGVPAAWLALLGEGVALAPEAALAGRAEEW